MEQEKARTPHQGISQADLLSISMADIDRAIAELAAEIPWAVRMGDKQRARNLSLVSERLKFLRWNKLKLDEKNKCREQAKSQ